MTMTANPIGWIEMPALDLDRAMKFYETVFEVKLVKMDLGELQMAMWPMRPDGAKGAGAALVKHEAWYKPATDGPLVYFTASSGDLKNEVSRVEAAGGSIAVPIKRVGEWGWMACAVDTEGNRFAIHSPEHHP